MENRGKKKVKRDNIDSIYEELKKEVEDFQQKNGCHKSKQLFSKQSSWKELLEFDL